MESFFNSLIYGLAQIIAKLMNLIVDVCNTLCGIPDTSGKSILVDIISPGSISGKAMYYIFGAFCIITGLISLTLAMFESFRVKSEDGIAPVKPYAGVLKGVMHMFLVSALFVFVIMAIGEVGKLFQMIFDENVKLGSEILKKCFDTSTLELKDIERWNNLWLDGAVPSWDLIKGVKGMGTKFNLWQALFSLCVVISPLMGIVYYMGKRLVGIIILFAISPVAFAMYPIDDGHAKAEWYKDMKGTLLGGIVMMIMFSVMLTFMSAIYGMTLVSGDSIINGIFQAFVVGAGVAYLISLTKQVLKYLGCDDALLSTIKNTSPMRALRAVKSGVKSLAGKSSRSRGKGATAPKADGESEESNAHMLQSTSRNAAKARTSVNVRARHSRGESSSNGSARSRMFKSSGNGHATKPGSIATSANHTKRNGGAVSAGGSTKVQRTSDRGNIRASGKVAAGSTKVQDKKGNKDIELFSSALNKFAKQLAKIIKSEPNRASGLRSLTAIKDGAKQLANGKADSKGGSAQGGNMAKPTRATSGKLHATTPHAADTKRQQITAKTSSTVMRYSVNNRTAIAVKNDSKADNNTNAAIKRMQSSLNRTDRQLAESAAKIKKISSNVQSIPRKIARTVVVKLPKK